MPYWTITVFTVACGFTFAALAGTAIGMIMESGLRFQLVRRNLSGACIAILLFMVAGPYMVSLAAMEKWRSGSLSGGAVLLAGAITAIWSFCSGVIVIQVLLLAGIITAGFAAPV